MWITGIRLMNIRGFVDSRITDFSKGINIFIGNNNSGKSTILKSLYCLQGYTLTPNDIKIDESKGKIEISYENENDFFKRNTNVDYELYNKTIEVVFTKEPNPLINKFFQSKELLSDDYVVFNGMPRTEPDHLFYPHFTKKKATVYQENITFQASRSVDDNYTNLNAKIDRLITGKPSTRNYFLNICENILKIPVTTALTNNGKTAVYQVSDFLSIPIFSMGEGTVSLLGLIVDLCISENKVFIIEEPENDIHPTALKSLLKLIEEKSTNNQFFITTHSNVVLSYLGGNIQTNTYKVEMELKNDIPNSNIKQLESAEERWQSLIELGYENIDFGFWNGWLFLEESTSELIIRDFLIPEFVPSLKNKLRTFSTRGVGNLKDRFEGFTKLFVYLHLEKRYKNKAWVIIDDGKEEKMIIDKMRDTYKRSGWDEENFMQYSKHCFEEYYPTRFNKEINNIKGGLKNEKLKMELFKKIMKFISENPKEAKIEFEQSAKEVINKLKMIESTLLLKIKHKQ